MVWPHSDEEEEPADGGPGGPPERDLTEWLDDVECRSAPPPRPPSPLRPLRPSARSPGTSSPMQGAKPGAAAAAGAAGAAAAAAAAGAAAAAVAAGAAGAAAAAAAAVRSIALRCAHGASRVSGFVFGGPGRRLDPATRRRRPETGNATAALDLTAAPT